jgi:flagellin
MEGSAEMISNSVNTNVGAMIALQNLNATNNQLSQTQNRVSTGLRVGSAKDNGAIWAIAQGQRSESMSLNAVKDSLARGQSTLDVAMAAGESISDLLVQMKEKALAASDVGLDSGSRGKLNEDFKALRNQIGKVIENAQFNGTNLLDGSIAGLSALANADGSSTLTVGSEDLSLGGTIMAIGATDTIGTITTASSMIDTIADSMDNVSAAITRLGTSSKAYETHATFVSKLQDTLDAGVGNLVDADLAKESAKLQALQTRQQLGLQALSIANQSPQSILSLFQ